MHVECIETSWLLTKAAVTNRIARSIFVALLAVAIATLPATVGFAADASSAANVEAAQAMPDCDHHHHNAPSGKPQKSADDGACLAACAIHCFNFTGPNVSAITFSSLVVAALKPLRVDSNISSLMGSPPFRPPRA